MHGKEKSKDRTQETTTVREDYISRVLHKTGEC